MGDKKIHFGWYIRHQRQALGLSRTKFLRRVAERMGVTTRQVLGDKRLFELEKMEEPQTHETTLAQLAAGLGTTPEELDRAWRNTPVSEPYADTNRGPLPGRVMSRLRDRAKAAGMSPADYLAMLLDQEQEKQRKFGRRGAKSIQQTEHRPDAPPMPDIPNGPRRRGNRRDQDQDQAK